MINIVNLSILLIAVLGLGSIGVKIMEKSGTSALNIEGTMVIAGACFLLATKLFPFYNFLTILVSVLIALLVGVFYNFIFSLLTINAQSNQFIVGIGMNIIAPILTILFLLRTKYSKGIPLPENNIFLTSNNFNFLYLAFLIVFVLFLAFMFFLIYKTKFGLELNALGQNPYALQNAGVNVKLKLHFYHAIAGMFFSLAGCFVVFYPLVQDGAKFSGSKSAGGLGFIAISIVILSQWKINLIGIISVLLAITSTIFYNFELFTTKNVTVNILVRSIPYLLTLMILPFVSQSQSVPKRIGKPFYKNKRNDE